MPRAGNLLAPPPYAEEAFPEDTATHYVNCPLRGYSGTAGLHGQTTLRACWPLIGWKPLGSAHHAMQHGYIRQCFEQSVPRTRAVHLVWKRDSLIRISHSTPKTNQTIPSLGILSSHDPVTITFVRDGHGLCTNGHGYLATRARSNRITIPFFLQSQS